MRPPGRPPSSVLPNDDSATVPVRVYLEARDVRFLREYSLAQDSNMSATVRKLVESLRKRHEKARS
jgi:hypothetical protein